MSIKNHGAGVREKSDDLEDVRTSEVEQRHRERASAARSICKMSKGITVDGFKIKDLINKGWR
jgi:hypothetical protein